MTPLQPDSTYHNVIEAESGGPGQYEHFYVRFDRAYALGDYLVEISCYDGLNLWAHATKKELHHIWMETCMKKAP